MHVCVLERDMYKCIAWDNILKMYILYVGTNIKCINYIYDITRMIF